MITKEDKILKLRKIWIKTYSSDKCKEIERQIELIEKCSCGGWITSFDHHYDWCAINQFSYHSYAKEDLDF